MQSCPVAQQPTLSGSCTLLISLALRLLMPAHYICAAKLMHPVLSKPPHLFLPVFSVLQALVPSSSNLTRVPEDSQALIQNPPHVC